jgi:hypothetical protein
MAAGSEGIVIRSYGGEPEQILVRFWDGGPLVVPADALSVVSRRRSLRRRPEDR